MQTLSKVNSETKFILKWGVIIIGSILFLSIALRIGNAIKEKIHPTPLPPPTVAFGKLDSINFPANTNTNLLTYVLDTISGTLPIFPDRLRIYKIAQNRLDFLTLEKIQSKVSLLGFNKNRTLISDNTYQWVDQGNLLKKISFNILTSNFTYSSSFITNPTIQSGANLPAENEAINISKSFLENLSLNLDDIDFAKTKTTLHAIKNYALIPSESVSKAQIIRVDFFQKDIDKIPIFYPTAHFSTINLLVSGGSNPSIVEASYAHKTILNEPATYPIKSASQAFLELKQGKASVSSFANNNTNTAIKNIYLGYYLEEKEQKYLMPIIIFEGDNFTAYISAVKDEWVNK